MNNDMPQAGSIAAPGSAAEASDVCSCPSFLAAQESETDNEGYGPLVVDSNGRWEIGYSLPPIRFCPWCGMRVPPNAPALPPAGRKEASNEHD